MLGADGLDLFMAIADSGMIEAAVNDLLGRSQLMLTGDNQAITASIKNHLSEWRYKIQQRVNRVGYSGYLQQELQLYQEVIHWNEDEFSRGITDVLPKLARHSAFYLQAKQYLDDEQLAQNPIFPRYFCEQWYKSLSDAIQKAQSLEIEQSKEKELAELYQRIETLKLMENVADASGSHDAGRLWDMAATKLSKGDIRSMHRYAEFLKKNSTLQEIAQQLGRMAGELDSSNKSQTLALSLEKIEEKNEQAHEDIVGIHEHNDLNKLLPNELTLLSSSELEVLFYQRLIDKRLLNYQMEGKSLTVHNVQTPQPEPKKGEVEQGPFIICVDASGSMSGFPEQCAKAMAYALMQIALASSRDCYVILFSSEQITYELTHQHGLQEMSDFLAYQFRGGTDFEAVLAQSLELLNSDKYSNADLIMISDFIAPKPPQELLEQVVELKRQKNRFYAISLSRYNNPELMPMFDHCWLYHPHVVERFLKRW